MYIHLKRGGFGVGLLIALVSTLVVSLGAASSVQAAACYESSIQKSAPFLGNHDEIFQLIDGSVWKVQYEYSYLYDYYPSVIMCPGSGKMIVDGKSLSVAQISGNRQVPSSEPRQSSSLVTVVFTKSGCDYFIADGPRGYYLIEWYGGYSPSKGDVIAGDVSRYGFKDVHYTNVDRSGRVYVEDYLLSESSVIKGLFEKCK